MTPAAEHLTLFVVLEGVSERLRELLASLAPLTAAAEEGPFLLGVDVYYRPDTDLGLLAIRFDERSLSEPKRRWVVQLAGDGGLAVLDPSRLDDPDRRDFYDRYLGQYGVRLEDIDSPGPALEELGRLLGVDTAPSVGRSVARDRAAGLAAPGVESRRRADARSRDSASRQLGARGSGARPRSGVPGRPTVAGAPAPIADDYHTDRVFVDLDDSMSRKLPTSDDARPRGKARHRDRVLTVPGRPLRPSGSDAAATAAAPEPSSRRPGSEPGDPSAHVRARYQRGDQWMQARLRSLSPKGALLATGAPPPANTTVRVALALAEHSVILDAVVLESTAPVARRSSHGFRVDFLDPDADSRERLIALLRTAKARGVSLTAPPPRRAARFPVAWPVVVTTAGGRVDASVLDVSTCGLFVATNTFIRDRELSFVMPLDRRGLQVQGRLRIAREVTEPMARARGLERGYGVEIVALEGDDGRFESFLDRVRLRSERHVVVAAAPGRLELLADGLAAAGYTVTTASHATDTLLKSLEGRAPDAAILDGSLDADAEARAELQEMLARYRVPCVNTRGERPGTARAAIDRLLSVATS